MKRTGKIYFWFLVIVDIIGYVANLIHYRSDAEVILLVLIDLVLSAAVLYVFYRIVFEKEIKHINYLRIGFPIFLLWEIVIFYVFQIHIQTNSSSLVIASLAWLVYLPEYIIVWLFVFKQKTKISTPQA